MKRAALILGVLCLAGVARADSLKRGAAPEADRPLPRPEAAREGTGAVDPAEEPSAGGAGGDLVEPDCLQARTCRPLLFVRPSDCTAKKRWYYERRTQRCEGEERLVLFVDDAGEVQGAQLPGEQPAGGDPIPNEVRLMWRACPEPEGLLDPLPEHLVRAVDPDLGRCLVAWPAAEPLPPDVAKRARVKGLDTLHPYVRAAGRELVRRAYEEGIEIKVISGYRRYKARVGYDRTLKRRRVLASWHAFGVALDINMMWAKGLVEASRRRKDDPEEHARWERLGEIGRSLGLRWGGDMTSDDIFHFEWHPGYGGRLQPRELAAFLKQTGSRGQDYERSWRMFEPGAKAIVKSTKLPPPPKKKAGAKKGKSGKKGKATAKEAKGAAKKSKGAVKKGEGTTKKAKGSAKKAKGAVKKAKGTAKKAKGTAKKAKGAVKKAKGTAKKAKGAATKGGKPSRKRGR